MRVPSCCWNCNIQEIQEKQEQLLKDNKINELTRKVSELEQKNKEFELGNKTNAYYISNPYIILFGICTYTKNHDLKATKVDVDNLYELFHKKYGYKYVFSNNDSLAFDNLTNQECTRNNIKIFLKYHASEIERINKNKNTASKLDSFIIYFSGHGDEGLLRYNFKRRHDRT